jgi:hypothetical protein
MDAAPALLAFACTALVGVTMLSVAGLRAWRGWLELRRAQLLAGDGSPLDVGALRKRVKRLEAIASGLDG